MFKLELQRWSTIVMASSSQNEMYESKHVFLTMNISNMFQKYNLLADRLCRTNVMMVNGVTPEMKWNVWDPIFFRRMGSCSWSCSLPVRSPLQVGGFTQNADRGFDPSLTSIKWYKFIIYISIPNHIWYQPCGNRCLKHFTCSPFGTRTREGVLLGGCVFLISLYGFDRGTWWKMGIQCGCPKPNAWEEVGIDHSSRRFQMVWAQPA